MPAAIEYIPPTDSARDAFSVLVRQERNARETKYRTALKYYLGEQPRNYSMPDPDDDEAWDEFVDYDTRVNMVKMTGDRTASFLFPDIPGFELDAENPEQTDEEKWLHEFVEYNGGLHMLTKWALRGFLSGHTFLKITPGEPYPRLTLLDPTSVTVFWRVDEQSETLWFEQRYFVGRDLYIQDIVHTAPNEWTTYTYKKSGSAPSTIDGIPTATKAQTVYGLDSIMIEYGAEWQQVGAPAIHTDEQPPIISVPHLPHPDDFYGYGEVNNLKLQDAINRLATELSRITAENADPVDFVSGQDVELIQQGDGNLLAAPNPAARVTRLELKSDMAGLSKLLEQRMDIFLAEARVVLLKGEAKDLQRVTNASVRTLFLDMIAKNKQLQASYGRALKQAARLAIRMAESLPTPTRVADHVINIIWGSALPTDMTEIANVNAIMVGLKARSRRTAAAELGDNWVSEKANIEAESEWVTEMTVATQEAMNDVMPQPVVGQPGQAKGAAPNAKQNDKPDAGGKPKPNS